MRQGRPRPGGGEGGGVQTGGETDVVGRKEGGAGRSKEAGVVKEADWSQVTTVAWDSECVWGGGRTCLQWA